MKWFRDKWDFFMNPAKNILKHMPPEQRFSISCLLSGVWSLAFCLYIGEFLLIAPYMIGHFAIICAIALTLYIFNRAKEYAPSTKNKVVWNLDNEA